jgi:membrane-bound lytic murein transglycosylase D
MMALMLRSLVLTFFLLVSGLPWSVAATLDPALDPDRSQLFSPAGYEDRIEFWKLIFTSYGRTDVVIHDRTNVGLIYKVISFDAPPESALERRAQQRRLQAARVELVGLFEDLARLGPESDKLGPKHHELLAILKMANCQPTAATLKRLQENIHFQRGIKEKFRAGLARSGRYLTELERIFSERGLPPELVLLPHVESSFDYAAYSSAGAAGIWQITRRTGKSLLKIGPAVDERLDPLRAAEAAAHLLEDNYRALGNWPLAITAYNHGKYGMLRAKSAHGSDLREIIPNYQSRIFGYAGQNFYAEFLAALEIARNHETYFPSLQMDPSLTFRSVKINQHTNVRQVATRYGVSENTLKSYNPHLTPHFWRKSRIVPSGITLRLPPEGAGREVAQTSQAAAPGAAQPPAQVKAAAKQANGISVEGAFTRYKVRRGDTLMKIARKFQVEVEQLMTVNGLRNTRIYLGQLLLIP